MDQECIAVEPEPIPIVPKIIVEAKCLRVRAEDISISVIPKKSDVCLTVTPEETTLD